LNQIKPSLIIMFSSNEFLIENQTITSHILW